MVWTFAQAIGEQVERVGAYAGFAAFFGLALLAILYFAQARELKRLRDWAGRAPERARELEERAMAQAAAGEQLAPEGQPAPEAATAAAQEPQPEPGQSGQVAPAQAPAGPAPATAAGRTAAAPGAAAAAGATAGAAAAATAPDTPGAATNGAPPAQRPEQEPPAEPPAPAEAAPAAEEQAPPAPARSQGPPVLPGDDEPATGEHDAADDDDFEPDTADTPAVADEPQVARAQARPAPVRPGRPRQGATPLRAGAPSAKLPPRRPSPVTPKTHRRRLVPASGPKIAGAVAAVLVIGGGAAAIFGTGGDDSTRPDTTVAGAGATPTATPAPEQANQVDRAATTVAVLNGTTTDGLAASLVERLTSAGYQEGPRGNNADQQRATSVVLFQDGARAEARDVGRLLEIDEVRQMEEAQTADTGDAQVVVIAGLDQAP